jgi:alkylhydroperoxidase/carboxymuconolactone decarboxylase family protein YurZ
MTNEQAYNLIGERAAAIAQNPEVKAKMQKCFEAGMTMEEIQATVTRIAIATLYGMGK